MRITILTFKAGREIIAKEKNEPTTCDKNIKVRNTKKKAVPTKAAPFR